MLCLPRAPGKVWQSRSCLVWAGGIGGRYKPAPETCQKLLGRGKEQSVFCREGGLGFGAAEISPEPSFLAVGVCRVAMLLLGLGGF